VTGPTWRKSSRSADGTSGDCVEVAYLNTVIGVRDSKNPNGPRLTLSPATWRALTDHIKHGRLGA
jgi:hypothetical protein